MCDGMDVFMDASFTIGNPVYDDNETTITFSDTVDNNFPAAGSASASVNCWMTEATAMADGVYTTCNAATANVVTVEDMKASGTNTTFKFRVLATLDTSANQPCKIESIETKTGAITIDKTTTGSALASFNRGSDNITTFVNVSPAAVGTNSSWGLIELADGTNISKLAGGETGDASLFALMIGFKVKYQWQDNTVITIRLPFKE